MQALPEEQPAGGACTTLAPVLSEQELTAFSQFGLAGEIRQALADVGWTEATQIQRKTLPEALAGRDLIVAAQTGSGKTAAFILPMLNRLLVAAALPESTPSGLILVPTRELAIQTVQVFRSLASYTQIKCVLLIGGEPGKSQIAALHSQPEVIIATPGRLLEHIEKGYADLSQVKIVVLDEADRMLDMGFADALRSITGHCPVSRQNLLFSATITRGNFKTVARTLNHPIYIGLSQSAHDRTNIVQQRVLADDDKHKESLVASLIAEESVSRVFVFCNSRIQAERLSHVLRYKKLNAGYLHGEVPHNKRKQIMSRFVDGSLQVLVATDLAARGLDINDMDLVINFNVPYSGDEYLHRIGRTGRAGQSAKAITLVSAIEWNRMSSIERYLKLRLEPRIVKGLKASYRGPKKLKKSGKAASKTKRKSTSVSKSGKNLSGKR